MSIGRTVPLQPVQQVDDIGGPFAPGHPADLRPSHTGGRLRRLADDSGVPQPQPHRSRFPLFRRDEPGPIQQPILQITQCRFPDRRIQPVEARLEERVLLPGGLLQSRRADGLQLLRRRSQCFGQRGAIAVTRRHPVRNLGRVGGGHRPLRPGHRSRLRLGRSRPGLVDLPVPQLTHPVLFDRLVTCIGHELSDRNLHRIRRVPRTERRRIAGLTPHQHMPLPHIGSRIPDRQVPAFEPLTRTGTPGPHRLHRRIHSGPGNPRRRGGYPLGTRRGLQMSREHTHRHPVCQRRQRHVEPAGHHGCSGGPADHTRGPRHRGLQRAPQHHRIHLRERNFGEPATQHSTGVRAQAGHRRCPDRPPIHAGAAPVQNAEHLAHLHPRVDQRGYDREPDEPGGKQTRSPRSRRSTGGPALGNEHRVTRHMLPPLLLKHLQRPQRMPAPRHQQLVHRYHTEGVHRVHLLVAVSGTAAGEFPHLPA